MTDPATPDVAPETLLILYWDGDDWHVDHPIEGLDGLLAGDRRPGLRFLRLVEDGDIPGHSFEADLTIPAAKPRAPDAVLHHVRTPTTERKNRDDER